MRSTVARIAAVAVALGLVLAGGYVLALGAGALDSCGSTALVAETVPDDEVDAPEGYVEFSNLTAPQRGLVRRAVAGESPDVDSVRWPWSESALRLRYDGDHYVLTTVTSPCPFPPEGVVAVGASGLILGLAALAVVGHRIRASGGREGE